MGDGVRERLHAVYRDAVDRGRLLRVVAWNDHAGFPVLPGQQRHARGAADETCATVQGELAGDEKVAELERDDRRVRRPRDDARLGVPGSRGNADAESSSPSQAAGDSPSTIGGSIAPLATDVAAATVPFASRMPSAIARSSTGPSLCMSAGARFTVIRAVGAADRLFAIAVRTRSIDSRTAVSGRPTSVVPGSPRELRSSSISHGIASIPRRTKLSTRAIMVRSVCGDRRVIKKLHEDASRSPNHGARPKHAAPAARAQAAWTPPRTSRTHQRATRTQQPHSTTVASAPGRHWGLASLVPSHPTRRHHEPESRRASKARSSRSTDPRRHGRRRERPETHQAQPGTPTDQSTATASDLHRRFAQCQNQLDLPRVLVQLPRDLDR